MKFYQLILIFAIIIGCKSKSEIEKANEKMFFEKGPEIRAELLRKAKTETPPSYTENNVTKPILNLNLFPEEGLTDPHVLVDNNRVYLFGGHDESWDTEDTWRMDRWEIRSTNNLINWRKEGEILPIQTYIGDLPNCWAGDIVKVGVNYYWYFSNRNISTGVMIANSPKGPWRDALGKPLLPEGIIGNRPPYDPAVYEENGVYTMFFGAGHYYAVTLGKDMITLADEPKAVIVTDKNGNDKWTADKPTVFKRGAFYYLVWGGQYAMSEKLKGPYVYVGKFLEGGHNDVFQWKGQYYVVMENKDISLFYRGISLKPLYFNEDGTVNVPKDDVGFPNNGREWNFKTTAMGWKGVQGTSVNWDSSAKIKGDINEKTIIESALWPTVDVKKNGIIVLSLKNKSNATKASISIATHEAKNAFWNDTQNINWDKELKIEFSISSNDTEFKEYSFKISDYGEPKELLKRLRIEPSLYANKGSWEIQSIIIKNK